MINAIELTLLNQLNAFWVQLVGDVGTENDIIPEIFANLPPDGDFGANWKAIGDNFSALNTGNPADDLSFILQFPSVKAHVPCVTVEVGQEIEEEVVGSFVSQYTDTNLDKGVQFFGGPFTKTYGIGIYSFNADSTLYLYSVIKYALLIIRDNTEGVSNIAIASRPMKIDFERFNPDVVYSRYLDIRVEGVLDTATTYSDIIRRTTVSATLSNGINPSSSGK